MGRFVALFCVGAGAGLLSSCDAFDNAALEQLKAELTDGGQLPMDAGPPPTGMDADVAPTVDAAADAGRDAASQPVDCDRGECWWSHETADQCTSAGLPTLDDRPMPGDTSELAPLYFGMTRMRLGNFLPDGTASDTAWEQFGFDLDGVCTNSRTCEATVDQVSCRTPSPEIPFDGENCRDNIFALLQPVAADVPEIGGIFGLEESVFNCALWRGDYNIITKLSGYNGKPDDDRIRVDFYTSVGIVTERGWECPVPGFDQVYPPWRVSDPWRIDEADLTQPIETEGELPDSHTASTDGYVRDGYIVATLPSDMLFRLAGDNALFPGFALLIQRGLWTGRLVQERTGQWRILDGLLAGVLPSDDLLNSFRQVGLCPGVGLDRFYESVRTYIEETADVTTDGTVDPDVECDAMSMGIMFEANSATPGPTAAVSELIDCPPPPNPPDMDGGLL